MNKFSRTIAIAGRDLIFETGKLARQAHGSVTLQLGETILLATACRTDLPPEEAQFFPLRVDYQEKFSASGKTLGGFIKREGKLSEREILISRLIDRPLRPMFEEGYCNEVQVLTYVLSYDAVHAPDPLAICAASAALVISDIPIIRPVAAVRVAFIEGNFVINPTMSQMENSLLDLILAGTEEGILMIEGYADFLREDQIFQAIEEGFRAVQIIAQGLREWGEFLDKPKSCGKLRLLSQACLDRVDHSIGKEIQAAVQCRQPEKFQEAIELAKEKAFQILQNEESEASISTAFKKLLSHYLRKMILNENLRLDGRSPEEIRPISIQMGPLPRTHGSALFTRGGTQALSVCTLGGEKMAQRYEDLLSGENSARRFYLQYFFPPFSVGEVGRMGTPGRREIGHGKLAERSLAPVLPPVPLFPYVIRLESNIFESNGSSSMASVCAGCLSLMDAGVPVKRPVAGIAMGLIFEGERFVILSDITGKEDAHGDMDLKVAGDSEGITAFQLDIKSNGITLQIMKAALAQAKVGLTHILHKMLEVSPKSKQQLSRYAPRIETIHVKPSKIGVIIGPGGKQIRALNEETGATVDIDDNGVVSISANSQEAIQKAKELIHNLIAEVEIGKTYKGQVVSIVPFGVFVKIFEKEGLCHISEFDNVRINNLHEVCKEGDFIEVKVLDINERGQIKLSRKATLSSVSPPLASSQYSSH